MVKRDEIRKFYKEKILLYGDSGTGKSYISMEIAKECVKRGYRVRYIDTEYGSIKELDRISEELTDEQLELLDYSNHTDFGDAIENILREDDVFIKIVDNLDDIITFYKTYLEDKFLEAGEYVIGDKIKEIKDRDTFQLPYMYYSKIYDTIVSIIYKLLGHKYHIIFTMKPMGSSEGAQKTEQRIFAKFDTIIETSVGYEPSQRGDKPVWCQRIKKNRGKSDVVGEVVSDIQVALISRLLK